MYLEIVIIIDFNNFLKKNKYLVQFVTDLILKENKKIIGINISYLVGNMMKKIIKEDENLVNSKLLFVDIEEFNLKEIKDKCTKLNKVNNVDIVVINQTFNISFWNIF